MLLRKFPVLMDIAQLLDRIATLPAQRKQELLVKYQTHSLNEQDAMELQDHLLRLHQVTAAELDLAQALRTQLESQAAADTTSSSL